MSARKFEGRFADYMDESDTVHDIELDVGGKSPLVLPVPTRAQIRAYEAVLAAGSQGDPVAFGDAQWDAMLGKSLASKVQKYFDTRPFYEFQAFREFLMETWFGRGANDVEGKS